MMIPWIEFIACLIWEVLRECMLTDPARLRVDHWYLRFTMWVRLIFDKGPETIQ